MTLILCEKHGTSGFFESCEHVHDLLIGNRSEEITIIRAYLYQMKVCKDCVRYFHLEKYVLKNPEFHKETLPEPDEFWIEFELAYNKMNNRKAWCIHCYDELLKKHNT